VVGATVEARLAGRFVETTSDGNGAFRMPGMPPGARVVLWVGGRRDPFIAERIDVVIPADGQTAELGALRLLRGDELATRLDGWAGLFVARRAGHIVVSAVSAWLPADLAGIEVGDTLVTVDGREVGVLGPRAVTFLLRGPTGSNATVEVQGRDGNRRTLSLPRVRR
jgi:predicted metalloprotease with PDZ domain